MKKIKVLFCGLLIGLSVLSYMIATSKSSARELLILNVEALTFDESLTPDCCLVNGTCFTSNGGFILGMAFAG